MPKTLRILLASFGASLLAQPACLAQDPLLRLTVLVPEPQQRWAPEASLAVQVEVLHPADVDDEAPNGALSIGAAGAAWPAAVTLQMIDPDGQPVDWPFTRSGTSAPGALRLVPGAMPSMGFLLPAAEGRRASPGGYTLRAALEVSAGDGWHGRIESAPLLLAVGPAVDVPRPLGVSLVGAGGVSPGDAWVFTIQLPPPLRAVPEDNLRGRYQLRLVAADGRELPATFAPVVAPVELPEARELAATGFGPVLAVLPPATTKELPPGAYEVRVAWRASDTASQLTGSVPFTVPAPAPAEAEALAERAPAQQLARLAHATALLWHAEFGNTAHLERVTAEAADVLLAAEHAALAEYAARPTDVQAAAALAEVFALQGDFEGALAFANVAQGLWRAPASGPDAPPALPPEELRSMVRDLEARIRQGHRRALPYLRAALDRARGAGQGGAPATPSLSESGAPAQWATTARASSEYRATDYSASQAVGEPDVRVLGDSPRAWAPKNPDAGEEWLELGYATPVQATAVRVVQSFRPGSITRLEVVDATGAATTVWTGPDTTVYPEGAIGVLEAKFAPPSQPVVMVRIVLDTRIVPGWNEIDAVQLIGGQLP